MKVEVTDLSSYEEKEEQFKEQVATTKSRSLSSLNIWVMTFAGWTFGVLGA